jgi:hypothetical protein
MLSQLILFITVSIFGAVSSAVACFPNDGAMSIVSRTATNTISTSTIGPAAVFSFTPGSDFGGQVTDSGHSQNTRKITWLAFIGLGVSIGLLLLAIVFGRWLWGKRKTGRKVAKEGKAIDMAERGSAV